MSQDETREEWQERIGIGEPSHVGRRAGSGPNSSRPTTVLREDKPGIAGIQTEHWDGRKDATVFPERAQVNSKPRETQN